MFSLSHSRSLSCHLILSVRSALQCSGNTKFEMRHIKCTFGCSTFKKERKKNIAHTQRERERRSQQTSYFGCLVFLEIRFYGLSACVCVCTPVYLQNVSETWIRCICRFFSFFSIFFSHCQYKINIQTLKIVHMECTHKTHLVIKNQQYRYTCS